MLILKIPILDLIGVLTEISILLILMLLRVKTTLLSRSWIVKVINKMVFIQTLLQTQKEPSLRLGLSKKIATSWKTKDLSKLLYLQIRLLKCNNHSVLSSSLFLTLNRMNLSQILTCQVLLVLFHAHLSRDSILNNKYLFSILELVLLQTHIYRAEYPLNKMNNGHHFTNLQKDSSLIP